MRPATARVVATVVATTLLAFGASADSKKRVYRDVYDDQGVVPYAVEVDGEVFILVRENKAREQQAQLAECQIRGPYQQKIIEQQEIAIKKLDELAAVRKQDLLVCVEDRRQAYAQLSSIARREQPFFEKPSVNQALGFAACAATFAVWQWSDR